MALYAIGDLHLSLSVNKPMDVFGPGWANHVQRLEEAFSQLTAEDVTCGTRRKIWWQCREGHVWRAVVYSRTGSKRCGCPICAGRVKGQRRRYAANEQSAARV